MAARWPTDWPKPLVDAWSVEPAPNTVVSEMENGASRVRRISRSRNDRADVAVVLSREQFVEFRKAYEDPLQGAHGAAWWRMPLFIGRDGVDTEGCDTLESCRFIGQWKATAEDSSGKYIRVAFQVEIRD